MSRKRGGMRLHSDACDILSAEPRHSRWSFLGAGLVSRCHYPMDWSPLGVKEPTSVGFFTSLRLWCQVLIF